MSKAKIVSDKDGKFCAIRIDCPGCKNHHVLPVQWLPEGKEISPYYKDKHKWTFNGDFEKPTFSPSILTRIGHYAYRDGQPGDCACDFQERFPEEEPWPWPCSICHCFVIDGKIQFLSDCTHSLANQTVDLLDIE